MSKKTCSNTSHCSASRKGVGHEAARLVALEAKESTPTHPVHVHVKHPCASSASSPDLPLGPMQQVLRFGTFLSPPPPPPQPPVLLLHHRHRHPLHLPAQPIAASALLALGRLPTSQTLSALYLFDRLVVRELVHLWQRSPSRQPVPVT